ncbi:MAG TPA: RibD family protein [Steroidobacteraceae bacterium]|nr:RibD family protein [Steroidobacteraceae bacterium]
MKPYVICHMVASIDGKILHSRWKPRIPDAGALFERLHEQLNGDAWLIGRVTGSEFAKAKQYDEQCKETFPREAWFAKRDAKSYGVVLDAHGKIAWGRADIGGDPIVVVLTEKVSDAHLAGLRKDGVSYFFAGRDSIDLALTLEILNRELGVNRVLMEGGGDANGECLRAGLIDEISIVTCPAVDGSKGAPSVFDSGEQKSEVRAPIASMSLESSTILDGGAVWLRYRVQNERSGRA